MTDKPIQKAEFQTETTRFDVTLHANGELEVYASDGRLWVHPHSDNVVAIRSEPQWADKTIVEVAENAIKDVGTGQAEAHDVAQWIFDLVRGRRRRMRYRKESE